MDELPLISVVMPAYNAEAFIDEALASIFAQEYPSFEVIVINDGSTDATAQRIVAYGHGVRYFEQPNSGGFPGSPRNLGLRHSRGEFICFLDADDIMLPGRLRLQADFLRAHTAVGMLFGDYQNFSASGPIGGSHFRICPQLQQRLDGGPSVILPPSDATALLLRENVGIPSSMMMRRKVLEVVPGFSTEFRVGEDFHFYYRILRRFSLGIVDQVVSWRRIHGNNITADSIRMLHSLIASRSALYASESSAENRDALEEYLLRCENDLAIGYANEGNIVRSIAHGLRVLRSAFPRRWHWFGGGLHTLARTTAIAVGLKRVAP